MTADSCTAVQRVPESANDLAPGDPFPGDYFRAYYDTNLHAIEKEKFLGFLCAVDDDGEVSSCPWNFWTVMLKNGNFDQSSGLCPLAMEPNLTSPQQDEVLQRFHSPSSPDARGLLSGEDKSEFPCFGPGCMNQPLVFLNFSQPQGSLGLAGGLYGTYDLDETDPLESSDSTSFFSVNWYKNESGGSWNFHHLLRVSAKYPWLMLYLRADAVSRESGGYPWDTRGMMQKVMQICLSDSPLWNDVGNIL